MYLITFHSQFDSNVFMRKMKFLGEVRQRPVPRQLSSSCGTCCLFTPDSTDFDGSALEALDFERVYRVSEDSASGSRDYTLIYEKE